MYRVIKSFSDLEDGGFIYNAGDSFPRSGKEVTAARIAELASEKNKRKEILIKSTTEQKPTTNAKKRRKRKNAGTDSQVD